MARRITDLDSPEFSALFTGFEYTAYRLERLPWYGVGYEDASFRAWQAGWPTQRDPARDAWTGMVRNAVAAGKIFQRVHLVGDLTDYLRYEFEHWYLANAAAGDDARIWPEPPGGWPEDLPPWDYWMFDSHDVWAMHYDESYRFLFCEQVDDPEIVVRCNYWRDAALHHAIPFAEYMRRAGLLAAS